MARDPEMPITDVQWVLGHALSTTQIYVTPTAEDVISEVVGHYRRQAEHPPAPGTAAADTGPSRWTCCSGDAG